MDCVTVLDHFLFLFVDLNTTNRIYINNASAIFSNDFVIGILKKNKPS